MSTSAQRLARREAGEDAILRGQHQRAAQRNFCERPRQARADREPGAGNVRLAVLAAEREIDDGGLVARHERRQGRRSRCAARAGGAAPRISRCGRSGLVAGLRQHEHVLPAHLAQPRRGHDRAHLGVIDQHDARAERADIVIGRLHQLSAGRGKRAGDVPGRIFGRIAHVEKIERALASCARQCASVSAIDARDAETASPPDRRRPWPRRGRRPTAAARARLPAVRRSARRASSPWCRCAAPRPCWAPRH